MHKSKATYTLIIVGMCFLSQHTMAATIDMDTVIDSAIPAGEALNILDGIAGPTVVDMIDGGVMGADVEVFDSSVFNHRGGVSHGAITANDLSTVNLFGGRIGDGEQVVASDNGTVNVYGGDIITGLEGVRNGVINIFGAATTVSLHDSATAYVFGTSLNFDETTRLVTGNFTNGTPINLIVDIQDDSARLVLVPEPSSWLLTVIGCLIVFSRRSGTRQQL